MKITMEKIRPTKIDKKTGKIFIENLKKQKYMVCFVYNEFQIGDETMKYIDIAQTRYDKNGRFNIGCRGIGYLDNIAFEYADPELCIIKYIHSFIECVEPKLI